MNELNELLNAVLETVANKQGKAAREKAVAAYHAAAMPGCGCAKPKVEHRHVTASETITQGDKAG